MFKNLPCLLPRIFGVHVLQVAEGSSDGQLCTCVCQLPRSQAKKSFLVHFAIKLMMLDGARILKYLKWELKIAILTWTLIYFEKESLILIIKYILKVKSN